MVLSSVGIPLNVTVEKPGLLRVSMAMKEWRQGRFERIKRDNVRWQHRVLPRDPDPW